MAKFKINDFITSNFEIGGSPGYKYRGQIQNIENDFYTIKFYDIGLITNIIFEQCIVIDPLYDLDLMIAFNHDLEKVLK